jgi:hypothetical protein
LAVSGDRIYVTEVGPRVFHVSVDDPDGDEVSYTATQPFCGTVCDLGGGLFEYTPNARATEGFVDHFAVITDDGHGGVVTKTVPLIV